MNQNILIVILFFILLNTVMIGPIFYSNYKQSRAAKKRVKDGTKILKNVFK